MSLDITFGDLLESIYKLWMPHDVNMHAIRGDLHVHAKLVKN